MYNTPEGHDNTMKYRIKQYDSMLCIPVPIIMLLYYATNRNTNVKET